MRRALLTVNYGNVLCDNSRRSMQAAAERWGASYIEMNEQTFPKLPIHPAAMKCAVFELTEAEEAFILDADTVVSSKCPNPYEVFRKGDLIAIRNGSRERFGDYAQIKSCERFEWDKLQRQEPRLAGAVYDESRYWNSGVILARRKHHRAIFALALDVCKTDHGCGWIDQSPLNMAAAISGLPVLLAEEEWNWIHPENLPDWLTMKKHVYHFAGTPGRERLLPAVIWN